MHWTLRAMALVFLICLIAWVRITFRSDEWVNPPVRLEGTHIAALSSAVAVPQEEIQQAITNAMSEMDGRYRKSNRLKQYGYVADWVSFLVTSVITLLCGYFGRPTAGTHAWKEVAQRSVKLTRILGFLAALAAVLTLLSSRLNRDSQDMYRSAGTIRQKIEETYQRVPSARDAQEARGILLELHTSTYVH